MGRPNKKISVFQVTYLKILCREALKIYFISFSGKRSYFMHFERHLSLIKMVLLSTRNICFG